MADREGSAAEPARARHTGRHIVLLRDTLGRAAVQTLHQLAGLHCGALLVVAFIAASRLYTRRTAA